MVAWLDALPAAERGLLRVVGAPGVGLTRFLGAVESMARLRGYQILTLTGSPALRLRQYGALAETLGNTEDGAEPDLQHLLAWAHPAEASGTPGDRGPGRRDRRGDAGVALADGGPPGIGRVGVVVGLHPGSRRRCGCPICRSGPRSACSR